MTLANIALWWCYLTGGAAAVLIMAATYIFALDQLFKAFKLTALIGQWRIDVARAKRGKILTTKSKT